MAPARSGGLLARSDGSAPRFALAAVAWLAATSCSGSSRQDIPDVALATGGSVGAVGGASGGGPHSAAGGGLGGIMLTAAGAPAGGASSTAGTIGAPGTAGVNAAGTSATGTAGIGGGGTGSSVGGGGPKPGFACYGDYCAANEQCIECTLADLSTARCVPSPSEDPMGYQTATSDCLGVHPNTSDCDGPEDCARGDYCVVSDQHALCGPAPAAEPAACCFTCDAPPACTLCWIDNDCQMGYLCTPTDAPNHVGGCRPAL